MATRKSGKAQRKRPSTRASKSRPARSSAPAFGAKSEFVRARPELSAQEIVAEAAKHGIELTTGHVYNIRALDRKKGGGAGTTAPRGARGRAPVRAETDVDVQFRTLVVRIGLDRAKALLSELEARLTGSAPRRRGRRPAATDGTSSGSASSAGAAEASS